MNAKADMPEISGGWEPTITVGPLEDKLSFVKHEAPRALAKYAEALTLRVGHHGIACRVRLSRAGARRFTGSGGTPSPALRFRRTGYAARGAC